MIRLWCRNGGLVIVGFMVKPTNEQELYRALGQRTADARRQRGWTQEQLAEEMGVAAVTVSRWETGQRGMSVATLASLADALDVSLGDLLDVKRELPAPERDPREQELLLWWRGLEGRDRHRMIEIAKVLARGVDDSASD